MAISDLWGVIKARLGYRGVLKVRLGYRGVLEVRLEIILVKVWLALNKKPYQVGLAVSFGPMQ